jgi:uncharacterized protein (DUF1697 family)
MPSHIALLRGINVGGRNMVPMAQLRAMAMSVGLTDAATLLQSGNLLFDAPAGRTTADLERLLEDTARQHFRRDIAFMVRSAAEWHKLVAANPFPEEAERDPGHLLVMCLKAAPKPANVKALQSAITGRETARAVGKQVYICYPDGIGDSKLTTAVIDRHLAQPATGRNWNTVVKIAGKL